ncbi:hypothetical protein E2C01_037079 [Portunus trituberculatus]|uniref:Uncharacterized protein n=1 Tax=Portunus trituberculatus TaxID=210409 RepID=A0A5B7F8D8_PORTR|nr:hypothetical protein [Portunus trituberculatus]
MAEYQFALFINAGQAWVVPWRLKPGYINTARQKFEILPSIPRKEIAKRMAEEPCGRLLPITAVILVEPSHRISSLRRRIHTETATDHVNISSK